MTACALAFALGFAFAFDFALAWLLGADLAFALCKAGLVSQVTFLAFCPSNAAFMAV